MAKKPIKSTALVPAGRRRPPAIRKVAMPVVMPATADTLRPALGLDLAVAKLVDTGGEVAREDGVVRVTGHGYATRECVVPAEEIFYDRSATQSDGARMPTHNVAWSQTFTDTTLRDDLFAWLAERVHRWDDWSEVAYRRGADALTRHLLSVIVGTGGLSR